MSEYEAVLIPLYMIRNIDKVNEVAQYLDRDTAISQSYTYYALFICHILSENCNRKVK